MPKINPVEILTFLAECFPQASFGLEQRHLHRPLKIGIDVDLAERCPAISRSERNVVLRFYTSRVAYLQSLAEGAARVDLDGNACGEVSAAEAAFAAARLAEVLAEREAKRAAKKTAAVPATAALKPASASKSPTSEPASPAILTRVRRPLLRLKAFSGGAR